MTDDGCCRVQISKQRDHPTILATQQIRQTIVLGIRDEHDAPYIDARSEHRRGHLVAKFRELPQMFRRVGHRANPLPAARGADADSAASPCPPSSKTLSAHRCRRSPHCQFAALEAAGANSIGTCLAAMRIEPSATKRLSVILAFVRETRASSTFATKTLELGLMYSRVHKRAALRRFGCSRIFMEACDGGQPEPIACDFLIESRRPGWSSERARHAVVR